MSHRNDFQAISLDGDDPLHDAWRDVPVESPTETSSAKSKPRPPVGFSLAPSSPAFDLEPPRLGRTESASSAAGGSSDGRSINAGGGGGSGGVGEGGVILGVAVVDFNHLVSYRTAQSCGVACTILYG